MNTYKAIIFDLGKVIFDLSFDKVFHSWASASNSSYEEIKRKFQFDDIFDKFEKNEVSSEIFRKEISNNLGLILTDQEFDEGWCSLYLDVYPGVDNLLATLKQDYQLVALTNTNSIHSKVWKIKYADTLKYFEQVFSSHELEERKPDTPVYQLILDYLKVEPQQAVFLDDNIANIQGANHLGIKTILVASFEQMITELQAIGVLK